MKPERFNYLKQKMKYSKSLEIVEIKEIRSELQQAIRSKAASGNHDEAKTISDELKGIQNILKERKGKPPAAGSFF